MSMEARAARPVSKAEAANNAEAKAALDKGLSRLREIRTWDETKAMELRDVRRMMKEQRVHFHIGRLFATLVEKNAELPDGHKDNADHAPGCLRRV